MLLIIHKQLVLLLAYKKLTDPFCLGVLKGITKLSSMMPKAPLNFVYALRALSHKIHCAFGTTYSGVKLRLRKIMRYIMFFLCSIFSIASMAGTPTCHEHSGGNFCQYTGTVSRLYVNDSNMILMYFDSAVDVSVPQSVGIDATTGVATALSVTDKPEFAKMFYSTVLAAQASKREVSIQMRGTQSGYLKVDRIWLAE